MSVGLPGSGIGGVFYLLSALWMPIQSAQRSVLGEAPKARQALRQTTLAVMIISMLWLTGVAIEWLIAGSQPGSSLRAAAMASGDGVPRILRAASFALTFGTLALVLLFVQVLRFIVPARPTPATQKPKIERKAA
jgi:hypothetical protein